MREYRKSYARDCLPTYPNNQKIINLKSGAVKEYRSKLKWNMLIFGKKTTRQK
jgi:hypothetical protein